MTRHTESVSAPVSETVTQALRGWLRDGLRLLWVRLELFSVEAREHVLDAIGLLLGGLAALLFLGLGLGFLAVLLTVLLWDSHRVLALAIFSTFFLTVGGLALWWVRRAWRQQTAWFQSSLNEWQQDRERL